MSAMFLFVDIYMYILKILAGGGLGEAVIHPFPNLPRDKGGGQVRQTSPQPLALGRLGGHVHSCLRGAI